MRKRLLLIAMAGAGLLALLSWGLPAGLGLTIVRWSHPGLAWSGSEGTVWRGAARDMRWQGLHLGRVAWRFAGMESWRGLRSRWEVTGESPQYRLSAVLSPAANGTLRISDAHGTLPAAWLDISRAVPLTFPTGRFRIRLSHLRLAQGRPVFAQGVIHWTEAGLRGLVSARLGTIRAQLHPVSGAVPGAVRIELDARAPADVLVQGNGLIFGQRFELDLNLRVAGDRPRLRERLLPFGVPGENGTIAIHLQGSLPP